MQVWASEKHSFIQKKKRENFIKPSFLGKIFFKIQDSIFPDRVQNAIIFYIFVLNEDLQETTSNFFI